MKNGFRSARMLGLALAVLVGRPDRLPAQAPKLDDPAILSLLARLTAAEVECTSFTVEHAALPNTKVLAQRLRDDHAAFQQEGKRLADQLGLTLDPGIRSVIADSHAAVLADLHAMEGINIDRAFVDHELGLLQFALTQVDRMMVPAAKHREVKILLLQAKPLLQSHLGLARKAKQEIRKTKAGG